MKHEKIGIDLGTYTIKMVVIEEVSDIFRIKYAKIYKVDSSKDYYKFLKECIKDFTEENGIRFASFSFSIPYTPEIMNIEFLQMPIVDRKILKKSIKYEIEEREFVDDLDSIHYNWEILNENENEYDIILTTIEKRIIKELANLKTIKWRIDNIELQPITVGRLIEGDSIVVDFGNSGTRVYMYKNGKISEVEHVDFGGKDLTQIIENITGIFDIEEVEDIKKQCFISNELITIDTSREIEECSIAITKEVYQAFEEIKRLVRSFELKNNIMVEEIYYIGETSNLLYFTELFSKELDVNIKPLELLTPKDEEEMLSDLKIYTLAGSSTLFEKYLYLPVLNFSKFTRFQVDLTPIIIGLACTSLSMHLGVYGIHKKYDKHIEDLNKIQSKQNVIIDELDREIEEVSFVKDKNEKTINTIKELIDEKKWLSDILYVLPDKTPSETVIAKVNSKDGIVVLNGYTKNYSDIGFLAMELEKLGKVTIDSVQNEIGGEIYPVEYKELEDTKEDKVMRRVFQITLKYNDTLIPHNGNKVE